MGLLLVLAVMLLPAAAVRAQVARIVGGTAPTQAWPAMGYLEVVQPGSTKTCGGTLVSGRWFLTAGHCATLSMDVAQLPQTAFTVNLGESDITLFSGPERFSVDRVERDPLWARTGLSPRYDVALLHLATPSPATPGFEPMRIVTTAEGDRWAPGVVGTVLGWGSTTVFGGPRSTQLQQAGVPILADATCAADYPANDPAPFDVNSMFCAGDGSADTCTGDSGGPILVPRVDTFVLAGVTSYGGNPCNDPARPGVYARVGTTQINSFIRGLIPTAAIIVPPDPPKPNDFIRLMATGTPPAGTPGAPAVNWDLDNDGRFDDDTGPVINFRVRGGSNVVRAEESYPDGDRAVAREVVTTEGSPAPQPPPPPPPPPKPAPPRAVEPPPSVLAVTAPPALATPSSIDEPALARLLAGPHSLRIRSLADGRMSIRVRCSVTCRLSARLTLDARTAKRVGLTRFNAAVRVGSGTTRAAAGKPVKLVVTLTARAVRKLRGAAGGAAKLRVSARAGTRVQQLERTFTLRR